MFCEYTFTAGSSPTTPAKLPVLSGIPRTTGQKQLVMFVHPHCQCTKASLTELSRALNDIQKQGVQCPQVTFVIRQPELADERWESSPIITQCTSFETAQLLHDPGGRQARIFGVMNSGTCCLFNETGDLQFLGGITISRGHQGLNPGSVMLKDSILHGSIVSNPVPVFGCALFSSSELIVNH